jgi:hypothetical protein
MLPDRLFSITSGADLRQFTELERHHAVSHPEELRRRCSTMMRVTPSSCWMRHHACISLPLRLEKTVTEGSGPHGDAAPAPVFVARGQGRRKFIWNTRVLFEPDSRMSTATASLSPCFLRRANCPACAARGDQSGMIRFWGGLCKASRSERARIPMRLAGWQAGDLFCSRRVRDRAY